MTIATLTGHCCLAYGNSYTAIMDNGPASKANMARTVQAAGEEVADPLEVCQIPCKCRPITKLNAADTEVLLMYCILSA